MFSYTGVPITIFTVETNLKFRRQTSRKLTVYLCREKELAHPLGENKKRQTRRKEKNVRNWKKKSNRNKSR
jgi:hypothetical protein